MGEADYSRQGAGGDTTPLTKQQQLDEAYAIARRSSTYADSRDRTYEGKFSGPTPGVEAWQVGGRTFTYMPYAPDPSYSAPSDFVPKPATNNVVWWDRDFITATDPRTGQPYGGSVHPRFDSSQSFEERGGDIAALEAIDYWYLNTGAAIIDAIDPLTGQPGIADELAFWQLTLDYEDKMHEIGVLGQEIPDYANANLAKLQGNAVRQGFTLNNFADAILEDSDPRSDRYFDDRQIIMNPNSGLIFNQDGMRPKDYYASLPTPRGTGPTGPVYSAPDEDVIRDVVRSHFRVVVGDVDENYVEQFKDVYMQKHRANFNNKSQDIDPMQAVIEETRKLENYKNLHKFRPADIDEFSWVSNIVNQARQQGGTPEEGRIRGLDLATQGATFADKEVFDIQSRGRSQSFLQRVGNAQQSLGGIIR